MTQENEELHKKVDQLEQESVVLDWYVRVMEEGHSAKTLLQQYVEAKDRISELEATNREMKISHEKQVTKLKD